jgi:glyoxylase-like metal-dependent hydrolase (beta-lactamase superfamily II)
VHTCILTHGHVDHFSGLLGLERVYAGAAAAAPPAATEELWLMRRVLVVAAARQWALPRVVAHTNVPARFERYVLTKGRNEGINARQFRVAAKFPQRYPVVDVTYTVREGGGGGGGAPPAAPGCPRSGAAPRGGARGTRRPG